MAIEKTTTQNGVRTFHTAGKYCDQDIVVTTSVPTSAPVLVSKTITSNGTYSASSDNADGYSSVEVNVSGGGGDADLTALIDGSIVGPITTSASIIMPYCFESRSALLGISLPNCTSIATAAFRGCLSLSYISSPNCANIGAFAFTSCKSLTEASFPLATNIPSGCFSNCRNLISASFPNALYVEESAFCDCQSLQTIYAPNLSGTIRSYAFSGCRKLVSIDFPNVTGLASMAFSGCRELSDVSLPNVTTGASYVFAYCGSLSSLYLPKLGRVAAQMFQEAGLEQASFPACSVISSMAFLRCRKLLSLYILSSSVVSLQNGNAFSSTPIAGYTVSTGGTLGNVFVPISLLTTYQTATNWVTYSSRIGGISVE